MPARNEIQKAIEQAAHSAQDTERRKFLAELHRLTERNVVIYASAFGAARQAQGVPPSLLSILPDDVQGFMAAFHGLPPGPLDLILHSPGGSLEAAEQIVNYMRAKFAPIRAIIPQTAMSAATMLACACDEIVMGKQSALGPIDPQLTLPHGNGQLVTLPAQAILDEFEKAKTEILQNPKLAAIWIPKLQALPHGILDRCTTTQDLAEEKVESWLKDYMKLEAGHAADAAKWLANAKEHKTHGRPICAELARQHHLKITPLEEVQDLQDLVLSVFHAAMVTFERTSCVKIVENHHGKGMFLQVNVSKPA
jgi:hypothetical protein